MNLNRTADTGAGAGYGARIGRALLVSVQGLALAVVSLVGSIVLTVLTVLSLVFIVLGVGVITTPAVVGWLRAFANQRRLWGHAWADVRIPAAYRPFPADLRGGLRGRARRCAVLLRDPATWRELLWLPVDFSAGYLLALLPISLVGYGLGAILLPLVHLATGAGGGWLGLAFLPLDNVLMAASLPLIGAGMLALALYGNPAVLRAHFRLAAGFLIPPKADLAERVAQLTESRHDAVDASAAELRRIERDLHDGAQARLVAMGMSLGTVEALIEKDPARARHLLAQARRSSAEALTELRDLVRGIHPPVLAERGLGDAVRALALRMALQVEVRVDLAGRAEAPVESAAYFAVGELLANAAKHAGAERVWVDIGHAQGRLRVAVKDDGRGGAVLPRGAAAAGPAGSGLRGLQRRLGTFDGVLAVSSPAGGPTLVTLEIPCALSSPKTSSS